ncbi:MAG: FISUMP domain-containing protein, partial [Bacteroidales bacterium]|nr:FISUMP domain-containing protein [Bacteroidales bacterium]
GLGPDRGVCSGDSVSLDAGAGMTAYLWNTGATSQTIEAKVSGSYSVIMHYKNCTFYDTVNVTAFPTPVVNLGTDDSICAGETHTFNAGFCSGCTYSWDNLTLGQTNIGTGQTYTTAQPGTYVANVTGNNGCIGRDTIRLLTKSGLPVNISILSSANSICSGIPVTYTATPVNGGTLPTYQWKVNDSNAGTNSSVFTYSPTNGDIVTCLLTSSISVCISNNPATSNSITMVVNPLQPVSVAVSTSANPVCAGTSVTFNAMPTNGGTIPIYQWKVNGIDTGSNLPVFNFTPINGDALSCALTSNANCPIGNPAFSIPINMVVNPLLPVSISISPSANPFCLGNPVTYTAIPVNGGPSPTYQWKVKGTNVGGNSPTYTYSPVNGDSVRCVMISNLNCVIENPASSAKIIMLGTLAPTVVFTSCFDTLTTVNAKPYKLRGGIPLGGTYSGPGVNSVTGIFTPSIAGTGLKSMVYTYTNVSLCSANKTNTIIVQSTASFTCGNNLTDIRDSKTYPTVQIGTQCWMAANLNYGNQITPSHVQFDNCIAEKYCYNDNPLNCTNNGGLYQWDEMMKYDDTPAGQGLCPPGWHVPTENDWTTLFNFYLGKAFAGKPLQDSIITGFKALTSGVFYLNSSWSFNGFATLFWSSTPWNATKGISHGLNVYDYSVSMYPSSRANAFPVRCLCD